MRLLFPILAVILILGTLLYSRTEASLETVAITTSPIALNAADLSVNRVGKLQYMGGIRLRSTQKAFGGLSGLDIISDKGDFVAVSDRGYWFTGRFVDDGKNFLSGIASAQYSSIQSLNRKSNTKFSSDAEAVLRDSTGSYYVSFERYHRVWKFSAPHDPAVSAEIYLANNLFSHIPGAMANKGIEAITSLPGNRLLLLSEAVPAGPDLSKGWIVSADTPRHLVDVMYQTFGSFRPTDMTSLPNGDIIVLERAYNPLVGASARIAMIKKGTVIAGQAIKPVELAVITRPLTVDNFEGIGHRLDEQGRVEIYIISDNNYNPRQRTLVMKFRLEE